MTERLIGWRLTEVCIVTLLCSFVLSVPVSGGESEQQPGRFVFELDEVSAFELDNRVVLFFSGGQRSYCTDKPAAEVKTYPAFKSGKPVYGSVEFKSEYDGELPRTKYCFALDESAGTGEGYDRFYFDLNRDLDLTNDAVLSPHKNPPNNERFRNSRALQETLFEYLHIPFEFGSEDVRPLRILPWFEISGNSQPLMRFVNPIAHKGKIELNGHRYDVFLGHDYMIAGWFHRPLTAVYLFPEGKREWIRWRGADRLMAAHKIGDALYKFSATPNGDKLTAREYNGPFGTFEIRPGRGIQPGMITAGGSFRSQEIAVAVGGPKCQVPVGDYLPSYLTIVLVDRMLISLSDNYHADGEPRGTANRRKNYAIRIREDKPFVLNFSNKPEVMFASPARDHRLKLGEKLTVKAVLVDPELDLMIRDLDEVVRSSSANGKAGKVGKHVPLDPKVSITRANGEKVAEGVMPFG